MKRRVKFISLLLTVVMVAALFTGCASKKAAEPSAAETSSEPAVEAKVLTVTFAPTEGSPHHKAGLEFARLVEEKTKGKYKVEVYPNSQLAGGNQLRAMEMVQKGAIDFGWLSPPVQTAIVPDLDGLMIPWLWKDVETIDNTLKPGTPVFEELSKIFEEKGYVVLAVGENGFRQVTNNVRELKAPDDFKGLKFRVLGSKLLLDVFRAIGANPTDINFAELFSAMQQKTVDGQENPVSTIIVPNRFYEVQKYMTLWDYSFEPHPFQTNVALWNSFDDETKKAIQEAAIEACSLQKKLARDAYDSDLKMLEEKGMKIYKPSPEELQVFKDKAKPIIEKFKAEFKNTKFVDLLLEANK